MSSWKQTLCVTGAFVVLVGGLAFAWNFLGVANSDDESTQAAKQAPPAAKLKFFTTQHVLSGGYEVNTTGRADFCFENDRDYPLSMRVDYQNCQCNKVEATFLTDAEIAKLPSWPVTFEKQGKEPEFLNKTPGRWHTLAKDGGDLSVPAGTKGLLRVSWTARQTGPHQAVVMLITQKPGDDSTRATTRLDAGAMYTPAVMTDVQGDGVRLPDLEPEGLVSAEFNCVSPTRAHFQLKVKDQADDPHFEFGVQPLSEGRLKVLEFALQQKGFREASLKSGYHVTVTARENVGGKHLDMGVFERSLALATDVAADTPVTVRGRVLGEVEVGSGERQGTVFLDRFHADQGTSVTVPLNSNRQGVQLKVESWQPSYLKVSLLGPETVGETQHWQLTVTVPARIPTGRLPKGSEVVLRFQGPQHRLIRIPVHGAAYE